MTNSAIKPELLRKALWLLRENIVIGKVQKSQVLTLFECNQSFFLQTKLPSIKLSDVSDAVIGLLRPYKRYVLTITTDNGIEFMNHKMNKVQYQINERHRKN